MIGILKFIFLWIILIIIMLLAMITAAIVGCSFKPDCFDDIAGELWGNKISDFMHLRKKTDSNNCATITKVKDSWSRDEVIELLHKAFKAQSFDFDNNLDRISLNNWIEQNL